MPSGLTTITRATRGSRSRRICELPVTSNATRSAANKLSRQHFQRLRRRRNPTRRTNLPDLADRDLTQIQAHVQPDRSTNRLHDQPPNVESTGEAAGNDTDGYVLAAQSGQVAGAATEKHGLEAHRPKRPAHTAFSQESPRPDHRNYATTTRLPVNAFSCPEKQHCDTQRAAQALIRAQPDPTLENGEPCSVIAPIRADRQPLRKRGAPSASLLLRTRRAMTARRRASFSFARKRKSCSAETLAAARQPPHLCDSYRP